MYFTTLISNLTLTHNKLIFYTIYFCKVICYPLYQHTQIQRFLRTAAFMEYEKQPVIKSKQPADRQLQTPSSSSICAPNSYSSQPLLSRPRPLRPASRPAPQTYPPPPTTPILRRQPALPTRVSRRPYNARLPHSPPQLSDQALSSSRRSASSSSSSSCSSCTRTSARRGRCRAATCPTAARCT